MQDTATSELLALKKIRCPFGAESVAQAMREVEAYRLFAHSAGVIHSVGYSIAAERGGGADDEGAKTVYVLLPYYRRGNLQDLINANLVNHARFPEKRLAQLFLGVCRALRDLHIYTGAGPGAAGADEDDESEQQRPLMAGEAGAGAHGGAEVRSYAHRDIKPGKAPPTPSPPSRTRR